MQQSRDGDLEASQQTLTASLDQLKEAAARCGNTPGCDPQRFFSVFDHLLRLKDGDFGGEQDLDSDVDASQAALAAGKSGAASLPQAQRSVTLLHGQKLSELIAMNGPVKSALEMWLTQWRPQLMDAYVNYEYMRFEMWPAVREGRSARGAAVRHHGQGVRRQGACRIALGCRRARCSSCMPPACASA